MGDISDYESMAMLDLSETEREALKERLDAICDDLDALELYDTSGVKPLVSVLDIRNVMREDVPEKLVKREELLGNAPEQHDGYFQVPATID